MTERDRDLIREAKDLPSMDWDIVWGMVKQADSYQAREILKSMARNLYHSDEYYSDMQ